MEAGVFAWAVVTMPCMRRLLLFFVCFGLVAPEAEAVMTDPDRSFGSPSLFTEDVVPAPGGGALIAAGASKGADLSLRHVLPSGVFDRRYPSNDLGDAPVLFAEGKDVFAAYETREGIEVAGWDAATGRPLWPARSTDLGGFVVRGARATTSSLYIASDNATEAFDRKSGERLQSFVQAPGTRSGIGYDGERLYVIGENGLQAVDPLTGAAERISPTPGIAVGVDSAGRTIVAYAEGPDIRLARFAKGGLPDPTYAPRFDFGSPVTTIGGGNFTEVLRMVRAGDGMLLAFRNIFVQGGLGGETYPSYTWSFVDSDGSASPIEEIEAGPTSIVPTSVAVLADKRFVFVAGRYEAYEGLAGPLLPRLYGRPRARANAVRQFTAGVFTCPAACTVTFDAGPQTVAINNPSGRPTPIELTLTKRAYRRLDRKPLTVTLRMIETGAIASIEVRRRAN